MLSMDDKGLRAIADVIDREIDALVSEGKAERTGHAFKVVIGDAANRIATVEFQPRRSPVIVAQGYQDEAWARIATAIERLLLPD